MKFPGLFGLGARVQPAIEMAKGMAVEVEREIKFHNKNLEVYEMTPSGERAILRINQEWAARKRKGSSRDQKEMIWEIEISKDIEDIHDLQMGAMVRIGKDLDYIRFQIIEMDPPETNFSFYKLIVRQI